jgi:hypothetical protein
MRTPVRRHWLKLIAIAAAGMLSPLAEGQQVVDFNRDVRPILSNKCFTCHGPDEAAREAGLRLDAAETASHELESGTTAIVPGRPDDSEMIRRVSDSDESMRMPPADFGKSLSREEIDVLRAWVAQGAQYSLHWSYEKPAATDPPAVPDEWRHWPRNEIDLFALESMQSNGLSLSPEADRYTLVRRVFLDLTGLPPTVEEVDAFVHDSRPQAYEELVDDLLRRPAYGEHWARMWLDLARYADSSGYAEDNPRTIWAYRDWVIKAFNQNKPFDQFTIEQIAGDLLPNATENQLIATAFHRNTLTNSEGGTQDEEFRHAAIVDRVDTTMAVWMGTTMACAQCHSHKYDPLSHREYFGLFAFFNSTEDADLRFEEPLLHLYSEKQRRRAPKLQGSIMAMQAVMCAPIGALSVDVMYWPKLAAALRSLQPETTVPIMRERAAPRETRIANRGNYLDKGDVVGPGVPAVFHAIDDSNGLNRLALARWLVDRDNPLTARVMVNRYWEALFDRGIVATSEDFGTQGELPTHPQLLDWLAVRFMDSGWDVRALIRLVVTSAVYRQSSVVSQTALANDSDNRWLARGPRKRLSAEMVRDEALAASGLLKDNMYGPPVRPPQPNLGLTAAFGGSTDWKTSKGDDRYRRAVYTQWRRSNPYPSMAAFDAPNRDVCTLRRNATNTPLQALVTLNDPVYVEAAQNLARRALSSSATSSDQITFAFRNCLQRWPSDKELQSLTKLYEETRGHYAGRPEAAMEFATVPLGDLPAEVNVVDAASMTVVCNVLMNLDEMFLKR